LWVVFERKREMTEREPVVAGAFYPADPERLRREVESYLAGGDRRGGYTGCVVPHAGYVYSGATAGKVLSRIDVPETVVILSPNHTGLGKAFSVWEGGAWRTPLGAVPVHEELREAVLDATEGVPDDAAHLREHSIEVVLPFLQVLRPDVRIVPVTIRCGDADRLAAFGEALAEVVSGGEEKVLLVGSSDMTHMESAESARAKDMKCIEKMESVDPEGLHRLVTEEGISMCGVYPVTALLAACRKLGIGKGELVEYTNSGEASGDYARVVGYAGMLF